MKNFTDQLIEFTKESETPTSFWRWGSYAMIAAVLRDNVFWNQMGEKICPNIYVLLNSDSATHRKGNPPKMADRLLSPLKATKIIRGRGSIQAILEDLANVINDSTGKSIRGGSCLLVADELKSFFVDDAALIGIMTDVYEYKEIFDYKLRGAGFKVKGLCISMLAASNDEFLKGIFTGEAVYGGLLGRTFLVRPDEYRQGNSLLETEDEEAERIARYDPKPLAASLLELSKLKGKVRFKMEAKVAYDGWYLPLRKSYERRPDKTGVLQRLHTGVLKIAVIKAIDRTRELIVEPQDIESAISECISLMPNYDGYSMSAGKSSESVAGSALMQELWMCGGKITRAAFLQKYWADVSAEVLDKVITTFQQAGYIEDGFDGINSVIVMTKKCKEVFNRKPN